ncbi:hypothetical protein IQ07DRAFT_683793 [Pyrenochaeta sp. DS3sAY3a]|nr:hypothetical protein IQ07DRAFT_683793 [Pyrenochaeta sp. DS3sAY3a]
MAFRHTATFSNATHSAGTRPPHHDPNKKWIFDVSFLDKLSAEINDDMTEEETDAISTTTSTLYTAKEPLFSHWPSPGTSLIITSLAIFIINLYVQRLPFELAFAFGVPLIHCCLKAHEYIETGVYLNQTEEYYSTINTQKTSPKYVAYSATPRSSHRVPTKARGKEHYCLDENHRGVITPFRVFKMLLTVLWYLICRILNAINPVLALLSTFILVVHWYTGISYSFTFTPALQYLQYRGSPRESFRFGFHAVVEDVRNCFRFWVDWIAGWAKSIARRTEIRRA